MKALWICLFLVGCASGSTILVGEKRPPLNPDEVKIYLEPPEKYEAIAIVKASSDAGWSQQGSIDYAMKELKVQAAKVGANGILFSQTGAKSGAGIYSGGLFFSTDEQSVEGKAILVQ